MMEATALRDLGTQDTAAEAGTDMARYDDGKLALSHSAMLIVLGSGGCWFLMAALVRWMLF